MSRYGQYCPLALAAETLGERWNLLIISRIIDGCHRFNDIHRGVPKISATLLSRRLLDIETAGLITRQVLPNGHGHEYRLTPAGEALQPIIASIAIWGQQWARDMTHEDLDPAFLVWSMHLRINTDAMPENRVVLEFEFSGAPSELRRFWIVCAGGNVDMCLKHPGYDADVKVQANLRLFVEAWRGFRDLRGEIACGAIRLEGASHLCRQFPEWLLLSGLADYRRERTGREQTLVVRRASQRTT